MNRLPMGTGAEKTKLKDLHLAVFFTRGVSLQQWDRLGLLGREVALYRALNAQVGKITFVTYGTAFDRRYARELAGISIQCNRWRLPPALYDRLLPVLVARRCRQPTIVKSNQVVGAEIALEVSRRDGRAFVARCGYLHSDFTKRKHGSDSPAFLQARALEHKVFSSAHRVVVTTRAMQDEVLREYDVSPDRIAVIPNYVQTDLFRPGAGDPVPGRICFIGRLEQQKNLFALLDAIDGLEVELIIVGSGRLRARLEAHASRMGLRVRFLGNLPHEELPELLTSAQMFVLPSLFEGHPKTLLEAMACGCPVVGTDVLGIRELIRHRETGLLCGTSPSDLRTSILELKRGAELRERLSRNAREYICAEFALERIIELELRLYKSILSEIQRENGRS